MCPASRWRAKLPTPFCAATTPGPTRRSPARPFVPRTYRRSKPWLTTADQPGGAVFEIHQDGKQGRNRPASAAEATVLSSITNAELPHLFALREEMRHWRLLQLDPALLRRSSPVGASDQLTPDGANLAAVLARLKSETADAEHPAGVLDDIAAELGALIPGVGRYGELSIATRSGISAGQLTRLKADGRLAFEVR